MFLKIRQLELSFIEYKQCRVKKTR